MNKQLTPGHISEKDENSSFEKIKEGEMFIAPLSNRQEIKQTQVPIDS